jgi:transposase
MKTIPLDTRTRILSRYDKGRLTRAEAAEDFDVSGGFVKKLLRQRNKLGHLGPLHDKAGRKPTVTPEHVETLRQALRADCGLTLDEMREALGGIRTATCIYYVLARSGISYKKKHCGRPSTTAKTCSGRAKNGRC